MRILTDKFKNSSPSTQTLLVAVSPKWATATSKNLTAHVTQTKNGSTRVSNGAQQQIVSWRRTIDDVFRDPVEVRGDNQGEHQRMVMDVF